MQLVSLKGSQFLYLHIFWRQGTLQKFQLSPYIPIALHPDELINKYLSALETADLQMVSSLFTEGAVVHSPLYGIVPSAQFYFDLFNDTSTSKITLLHVFSSTDDVNTIAAYFHYDWVLKDGTPTGFDCVDVFRLDEAGKITSLHIIYDTAAIRPAFINL